MVSRREFLAKLGLAGSAALLGLQSDVFAAAPPPETTTIKLAQSPALCTAPQIVAEELPIVCLASPHILVGARPNLGNFRPAIIENYVLWNADELFWRVPAGNF